MGISPTRLFGSFEEQIIKSFALKLVCGCIAFLGISNLSFATHNRAGEITYVQIDELTIRATITTYTKTSSFSADRDSVEMFWGDGTSQFVKRDNGKGSPIENDVKINYYTAEHTYPSRGTYTMGMLDPNRVAGILNVDFPNSVNITFYVQTTFTLLNTQFQGSNSSVILLQPPIDLACVEKVFVHNPNAFDPDGDSISYEFAVPFQDAGMEVPNYLFPDQLNPGPNNVLTIDPITGEIRWDSPKTQGEVNITIRINEYREGVLINSLIRDMQVTVTSCIDDPTPPTIEVPNEICVIAGEKIELDVITNDLDEEDLVIISATGGPFLLDNSPAEFNPLDTYAPPPVTTRFIWQTTCHHVRKEAYQVVFKSVDDSRDRMGDVQGLATLKTLTIRVVAPPPLDPDGEVKDRGVELTWESPYRCEGAADEFFRGFTIWRRNNSKVVPIDTCKGGLDGFGYEKVIFLTNEIRNGRYFAKDDDVMRGQIYCYRIVAEFAKLSASGNPFNLVESIRSEEVCLEFLQDRPLLTKVSVNTTDPLSGMVEINWVPPVANDLDIIANPGPYRYSLLHKDGGGTYSEIGSFPFVDFIQTHTLAFTHENLNTESAQHTYKMDFYTAEEDVVFSSSPEASSLFLNLRASDNLIDLSWNENVPWSNFEYDIFKQNDSGGFDSIGLATTRSFTDFNVENGTEYCYKVVSKGQYRIDRVPGILINESQIACAFPLDTVPPCQVSLNVSNLCDDQGLVGTADEFINNLSWRAVGCNDDSDIIQYNIYYAEFEDEFLELIGSTDATTSSFVHRPDGGISGCYAVTTLDIVGNESLFSNKICLDNCPLYELPNTFTPNGDGANDLFIPRINRFIATINLEVYNKWGQVVFKTDDPEINWNGTNIGGKDLADGSYYYTARVVEKRLTGNFEQEKVLTGYINLIR